MSVPYSIEVLREAGEPLDLREITKRTSNKLNGWSIMYRDVEAVLESAEARGECRVVTRGVGDDGYPDYRRTTWVAT